MPTTSITLPNYREPFIDAQGNISRPWWLFLQGLAKTLGGGQVPDLSTIIAALTELTAQVQDQALEMQPTGLNDLAIAISELAGRLESTQNVSKLQSKLDELETVIGVLPTPVQNTPFVEPFNAPTLINSWVNFGGGVQTDAGYYKDPFGIVHLRGLIKTGVIGAAAFVLPPGYRPFARELFAVNSNDAYGSCVVDATGNVTPSVGNNNFVSLAGITFRAA